MASRPPVPVPVPVPATRENIRAEIARLAIRDHIAKSINAIKMKGISRIESVEGDKYFDHIRPLFEPGSPFLEREDVLPDHLPNLQDPTLYPIVWPPPEGNYKLFDVAIVGAGMAGLYTGMLLDKLKIRYHIIEASDRVGGRVYTHRFTNDPGDYYDVGAMRFPDNPIMKETFALFKELGIEKNPNPDSDQQERGQLIPYYLTGHNTPSYYNGHRIILPDPGVPDPFRVSKSNGGMVLDRFVAAGPDAILSSILDKWRADWVKDKHKTWKALKDQKDAHGVSTRQEILTKLQAGAEPPSPLDGCVVASWCETMRSGTCTYDQAFIETFIHSMDFDYPVLSPAQDPEMAVSGEWWCLNGGADILAQKMTERIGESKITRGTRVTAISRNIIGFDNKVMDIFTDRSVHPTRYSHVITTTTTPCLQSMDLKGCDLSYAQKEAIRVLRYTPAVKMGIKFAKKWWITAGIDKGGQGKTDRPTRTAVYPSYALNDPADGPGVLLACYNSSMDAARLGGFARGTDPTNQQLILDVILHDLALMHKQSYETLRGLVISHHFHDWSKYEFTSGAWGEFGPTQFTTFLGPLQQPAAAGRLFFAGELTSIYHGWIVAALKSARRAVNEMLLREGQGLLVQQLDKICGLDPEQDANITDWLITLGILAPKLGL